MRSTITELRDLVPLKRLSRSHVLKVAEAQANRLLRLSGVDAPPVSEDIIAALPRIQIERVVSAPAQAAAEWSHGRWVVLLNGAMSRGRQRFSLAHELKHILDHPFVTILYPRQDQCTELAEQACDYFAACLLMPKRWLRMAWADGVRDVRVLARRFGVTPQAIRVRLLQIGLIEPTSRYLAKES
ncbi:MAG TPA: ImmA/IrrE family metallo-endopeptidase [Ktedonobacterales bacterium]